VTFIPYTTRASHSNEFLNISEKDSEALMDKEIDFAE